MLIKRHSITVVMLVASVFLISTTVPTNASPQIQASSWALETIRQADDLSLIPHSLHGLDLRAAITRGEFAALAVRLFEYLTECTAVETQDNPFRDTDDAEVRKAYHHNLMVGTSLTEFSPQVFLNRETAASTLANLVRCCCIPDWETGVVYTIEYEMPPLFIDDESISVWARESVYLMVSLGIIEGMPGNVFAPRNLTPTQMQINHAGASREQAIVMVLRMAENLKGVTLKATSSP